jgi:CsoR family transcriptional regulator, copper-sensing transcriptional repressor
MLTMTHVDANECALLIGRLKSIEGQARGVQRMLEEQRDCQEIIDQLAALRAASHAVTMQAIACFARQCLADAEESPEAIMTRLMEIVARLTR